MNGFGNPEEIQAALHEATQPLLEVAEDEVALFAVNGHVTIDCIEDRVLCGLADVAEIKNGALVIPARCGQCPTVSYPLCM